MKNPIKKWFNPHPIFWVFLASLLAWWVIISAGRWLWSAVISG